MTIRAVFRVQCDGPCKGWLSWREGYVPGTDMLPEDHVIEPTAVRALNWPTRAAAMAAALVLGWTVSPLVQRHGLSSWYCPEDRDLCGHGDNPDETCEGCYG